MNCAYCGLPGHDAHCDCGRPAPCTTCTRAGTWAATKTSPNWNDLQLDKMVELAETVRRRWNVTSFPGDVW